MNYKEYPNSTNTPNRKSRKSSRRTIFETNRKLKHKQKAAKRKLTKEQESGG